MCAAAASEQRFSVSCAFLNILKQNKNNKTETTKQKSLMTQRGKKKKDNNGTWWLDTLLSNTSSLFQAACALTVDLYQIPERS